MKTRFPGNDTLEAKLSEIFSSTLGAMTITPRRRLNHRRLGPLALEQRFMFDGAAVTDAAHAALDAAAKSAIPDAPAPVEVRAADINHSEWDNRLETDGADGPVHHRWRWDVAANRCDKGHALRLGFRQIDGFREAWAHALADERRANGPFAGMEDLARRVRVPLDDKALDGPATPLPARALRLLANADACRDKRRGDGGMRPLEFHQIRSRLAQNARAGNRLFRRVIGAIRQIGEDHRLRCAAPHRAHVMGDVGERHFLLALVAEDIGADAVADENDIDAGRGFRPRGRIIIGGEHCYFLTIFFHFLYSMGGYPFYFFIYAHNNNNKGYGYDL